MVPLSLFVFFVVIVTGNHFWVDGVIGWMVAGYAAAFGAVQRAGAPGGMGLATGDRLTDQPGGGPQTARHLTEPALVAGLLSVVYLIVEPSSADHAAQVFRSGLFESEGLSAWNKPLVRWPPHARLQRHLPAAGLADRPARGQALAVVAAALLFAASLTGSGASARGSGSSGSRPARPSASSAAGSPSPSGSRSHSPRSSPHSAAGARSPSASPLLCPLASPVAALLACGAIAHSLAERSRAGLELAAPPASAPPC